VETINSFTMKSTGEFYISLLFLLVYRRELDKCIILSSSRRFIMRVELEERAIYL